MLHFKQFKPYCLNWPFLANLPLIPATINSLMAVTPPNIREFISKIPKDIKYDDDEYDDDSYGNCIDDIIEYERISDVGIQFNINGSIYNYINNDSIKYLSAILWLMKYSKGIQPLIEGTWQFVEEDGVVDDVHDFFRFFIHSKTDILVDHVSLSVGPGNMEIMQNLVVPKVETYSFANDRANELASIRLCWDKWLKDTRHGQLYAAKDKILKEMEQDAIAKQKKGGILSWLFGV